MNETHNSPPLKGEYNSAITNCDLTIALLEGQRDKLGDSWPTPRRNELAAAYVNRGNAKQSARGFGPVAAIADYDQAVALMKGLRDELGDAWPMPWRNELAKTYMNRGVIKQDAPGFGPSAAITDYDEAAALMERLRDDLEDGWPVSWRSDLAQTYMNRGNAKQSAPGYGLGTAIADYDRAIALIERLHGEVGDSWPVPWRSQLANAYMNRGVAKLGAPDFGPDAAVADHDQAIALMEHLRDELREDWPVPLRNELARAYLNRGNAKQSPPGLRTSAAIADYNQTIALIECPREEHEDGWPASWRNDLAAAYINRGAAKHYDSGFGPVPAIKDYDRAIVLMERLRDEVREGWLVPWCNHLAAAYMNRGNAKQDAPGFEPVAAITDYDQAIALRESLRDELGDDWPAPWRNDLAAAYINRGVAKQNAPGFGQGAAIDDYDQAIAIMERLREELGEGWPIPWRNDLAAGYINRGNAKQDAPGFGPAAATADYDRAQAISGISIDRLN